VGFGAGEGPSLRPMQMSRLGSRAPIVSPLSAWREAGGPTGGRWPLALSLQAECPPCDPLSRRLLSPLSHHRPGMESALAHHTEGPVTAPVPAVVLRARERDRQLLEEANAALP
jgi:hypothetical protein